MAAIDIKKEAKNPYGAYLLFGEEDYLKRYYASEIRRAVVGDSPYAPFNHILFSPDNFTAGAAADALVTPPVFEEKKLIELCAFNFNDRNVRALRFSRRSKKLRLRGYTHKHTKRRAGLRHCEIREDQPPLITFQSAGRGGENRLLSARRTPPAKRMGRQTFRN